MIPYINHLLNQWGLWCVTGREHLGYPRQAAFLNGQPTQHKCAPLSINDDDALRIQQAVNRLDNDLKRILIMFYVKMRSCDSLTVAKACGRGKSKFYDDLHRAHAGVMFWLQEIELESPS